MAERGFALGALARVPTNGVPSEDRSRVGPVRSGDRDAGPNLSRDRRIATMKIKREFFCIHSLRVRRVSPLSTRPLLLVHG
jgi:hypothetical protein